MRGILSLRDNCDVSRYRISSRDLATPPYNAIDLPGSLAPAVSRSKYFHDCSRQSLPLEPSVVRLLPWENYRNCFSHFPSNVVDLKTFVSIFTTILMHEF